MALWFNFHKDNVNILICQDTSKPYSGDFYSLVKNYVKNFGICNLSNKEKEILDKMTDKNEIDDFLFLKYDINNNDIDL
jgi:hypothetical protein